MKKEYRVTGLTLSGNEQCPMVRRCSDVFTDRNMAEQYLRAHSGFTLSQARVEQREVGEWE